MAENATNESSWGDFNFLVLRCDSQDRCGDTADRLKAIPAFFATQRVLQFRWSKNRPFPLEEFLLPGRSFNWTVPRGLQRIIETDWGKRSHNATLTFSRRNPRYSQKAYRTQGLRLLNAASKNPAIRLVEGNMIQVDADMVYRSLAMNHRNKEETVSLAIHPGDEDCANFFHELFFTIFTPTPPIRQLFDVYMEELGIILDMYVASQPLPSQISRRTVSNNLELVDTRSNYHSHDPLYRLLNTRRPVLKTKHVAVASLCSLGHFSCLGSCAAIFPNNTTTSSSLHDVSWWSRVQSKQDQKKDYPSTRPRPSEHRSQQHPINVLLYLFGSSHNGK